MSQQNAYNVPGQNVYPAQPQKKSHGCLIGFLVMLVLFLGLFVLLLGGIVAYFVWPIEEPVDPQLFNPPLSQPLDTQIVDTEISTSVTASANVHTGENAIITAQNGASLQIPAGAVPAGQDGQAGTMLFSIESANDPVAPLPEGFSLAGTLYRLGPEGFNFNQPVLITLPIPDGVDIETVAGLVTFDTVDQQMKLVPSIVDRETRTVSASTIHLSMWGVAQYYQQLANLQYQTGGDITVHLPRTSPQPFNGNDGLTEARYQGRSFSYGVCIESYSLDNNDDSTRIWPHWETPTGYLYVVNDSFHGNTLNPGPRSWWVPAGTYQLSEIVTVSEINPGDPLYLPEYKNYWRPLGNVRVDVGGEVRFSFSDVLDDFVRWQQGRPTCYGLPTLAVGTGDVQITLTWDTNDDLDLHVFDPSGEEVFYSNPQSASGGQLDQDNQCSNMVVGRPENIFWPHNGAPSGTYRVVVHYYGSCDTDKPVHWNVRIVNDGQAQTYSGTVRASGEIQEVTTFEIP